MTATHAQIRAVQLAKDVLFQDAPQGAIKVLNDAQRGSVITDWLVHGVRLDAEQLEALGNYLCNQAWMMKRDKNGE